MQLTDNISSTITMSSADDHKPYNALHSRHTPHDKEKEENKEEEEKEEEEE